MLFGEAVSRGIMGAALAKELYLVVALRWVCGWGCMAWAHARPCVAMPRLVRQLICFLAERFRLRSSPLLPPLHTAWR